ncbi:dTDP-4-dehydrorhamnose reductase [Hoylesella loescheii]|uniref:dTDP-4-dehydrorhamnose reductase n=1 Tax=Hoylesella loescheii DSM 19665 = JCM 12249 = ATCC 15930 TaxID=1122985 RepID=A0A069QLL1_HOYLO|nr:dTDP-4-dehydrorhamnose reductase [Hoylesella loescheii]KDR53567.1 dTDP-4-dehydrorhamnose reductase [Hoylesella loescheii DSM 19665 = JCM 12249 = ATCC 15930]
MNILITGCNGQLGNEIKLLQAMSAQHTWFNTDVNELDITDKAAIERFVEANEIGGIVNCAAYTAVDKAESDLLLARKLNADAPAFLAEAVAKRGGWMVQVSTDYVFDGTKHTPYVESDEPCPNSVYGQTKLEGEQAVAKFCSNSMIIRTAWLYSEFGNNFVKTMIRLGKEREQLGVIFDQVGTPTYAHDLATVIMTAIDKGIKPGVYHFSNEGVTSWYDFTKSIHRLSGITTCKVSPLHTVEYPTPANRPAYSVLDKTKVKTTYGIEIPHWEESLAKCIAKL